MGTPLKNPPVYFTLAQVRFNPLLKLQDFLPPIQEQMRKAGYPDFSTQTSFVLQFSLDGKSAPTPIPRERFTFGSADRKHAFVLDQDSLTLQSTQYGRFEEFSKAFTKGLAVVHEAVQLAFVERVGLRYLDRVVPFAEDALEAYLHPEVLGLSARLKGAVMQSYSETLSQVDNIVLRSRVVIQEGGLSFPPDLSPGEMTFDPSPVVTFAGRHAILDNDGVISDRSDFDLTAINKQLDAIHVVIGDSFRASATEHAFKVWSQ
ncbi:TIGR04255 family protein [Roseateles sp. NT4]|uniref:TIGR04255 family protein n=1 Tax=Roseateles sp. NT4 TaxID=3453715 RepID=UPI003EEE00D7